MRPRMVYALALCALTSTASAQDRHAGFANAPWLRFQDRYAWEAQHTHERRLHRYYSGATNIRPLEHGEHCPRSSEFVAGCASAVEWHGETVWFSTLCVTVVHGQLVCRSEELWPHPRVFR